MTFSADWARRMVKRSRSATEALQRLQFLATHVSGKAPIVIHQMARVGSITVLRAIRTRFPRSRVFHTHYLDAAALAEEWGRVDRVYHARREVGLSREFLAAEYLTARRRRRPVERWKVVTLVRDPLARTISAFFRHFSTNYPELAARFHEDPRNVDTLLALFQVADERERQVTLGWFDREVRDVFGIDVFATPFATEDGTAAYSSETCDLLLLRTEDLDQRGGPALQAFLETPGLSLVVRNRGSDQPYGAAYKAFLERLRFSDAYLDAMYESRLARHFYDADERARMRACWTRLG